MLGVVGWGSFVSPGVRLSGPGSAGVVAPECVRRAASFCVAGCESGAAHFPCAGHPGHSPPGCLHSLGVGPLISGWPGEPAGPSPPAGRGGPLSASRLPGQMYSARRRPASAWADWALASTERPGSLVAGPVPPAGPRVLPGSPGWDGASSVSGPFPRHFLLELRRPPPRWPPPSGLQGGGAGGTAWTGAHTHCRSSADSLSRPDRPSPGTP